MQRIFSIFISLLFLASCSSLDLSQIKREPLKEFIPEKPVKIALVLGGGGSKGIAHVGAIEELEAAGIRPDLIIGCSAGAIVGALYSDNPQLDGVANILLNLRKSDLLDVTISKPLFGPVKGRALRTFMRKHLRSQQFKELKIPLIIIATDLFSGEVIELVDGNISVALGASCAVPGIFEPRLIHGRYLVDGGVACPIPVDIAQKYGAEVIIAIDVSEKLPRAKPNHLFGVAKRGVDITYQKFLEQSLQNADVAIKMDFQDVGTFSDHLNQEMYEHGRQKAREMLPQIQEILNKN